MRRVKCLIMILVSRGKTGGVSPLWSAIMPTIKARVYLQANTLVHGARSEPGYR
jgi:hypothetical protein